MGGYYMFGIESIRLLKSQKNLRFIVNLLYVLDGIISNGWIHPNMWKKIDKMHIKVLQHLMKYEGFGDENQDKSVMDLDPYIYESWGCFIQSKQHLHIRLHALDMGTFINREMTDLIMHSIVKDWEWGNEARDAGDMTNLIKAETLKVFKYTRQITLRLSRFRISLQSLLSLIKHYNLERIDLVLGLQKDYDKLCKIYNISLTLKEAYNAQNYEITDLLQNVGPNNIYVGCTIFCK